MGKTLPTRDKVRQLVVVSEKNCWPTSKADPSRVQLQKPMGVRTGETLRGFTCGSQPWPNVGHENGGNVTCARYHSRRHPLV